MMDTETTGRKPTLGGNMDTWGWIGLVAFGLLVGFAAAGAV